MEVRRRASATWSGEGKAGKGTVTTQSKVLNESPVTFGGRFGDEPGTNPEELVGAAHAGCFSMKLSIVMSEAGFASDSIDTKALVVFIDGKIARVELKTRVKAEGLDNAKLQELATDAKENCPISKSLNAEITLEAELA